MLKRCKFLSCILKFISNKTISYKIKLKNTINLMNNNIKV